MCNCIETMEKLISEKTGDPDAYLGVSYNPLDLSEKPTGMYAMYREKKKDGTFKERETRIGIVPTYCPFCGKKYDDEASNDSK